MDTALCWIRLILQSLHSPTTGLTDVTSTWSSSHCLMVYSTRASAASPTFRVLVRAMGVSRVPSSSTWTRPQVLPNPLCTYPAAMNLRSNTFPGPGTMTVTPVLLSPFLTVLWPTSTPGTSVILFLGPVFMTPGTMPKSLILFLSIFFSPPTASGLHVDYSIGL